MPFGPLLAVFVFALMWINDSQKKAEAQRKSDEKKKKGTEEDIVKIVLKRPD